jgi:ABC-type multidrug transport system ATPase subunit
MTQVDLGYLHLQEAGLAEKRGTRVGGIQAGGLHVNGLSNGERRRLSLVCAAIASPSVLFLDGE